MIVACSRCRRSREHYARGLCSWCHKLSSRSDQLPPRRAAAPRREPAFVKPTVLARVADYAELRQQGLLLEVAADRLGVTERTAWRYEARLRTATDLPAVHRTDTTQDHERNEESHG